MQDLFIEEYLSKKEQDRLSNARFGQPIGIGSKPAVVIIDAQNYMAPPAGLSECMEFPSSCGEVGNLAVERIGDVLRVARELLIPIFYTQFVLRRDGSDVGVYGLKRAFMDIEGWCLEGTLGADFIPGIAPLESEVVLVKKKPSAFFGTPFLSMLIDRGVDSLIVMGGSTSNCVRATVVDGMSFNFRVTVVEDAVFDRVEISHKVALFDMQRQYADVLESCDVIKRLCQIIQG